MRAVRVALLLFFVSGFSWADGLSVVNGRYPGAVLVFDLTPGQKEVIKHYRSCQLENNAMNIYTPYIFKLTASQSAALKAKVGRAPTYFNIYETVRGFNDAGPHWNLVLRFSENQIEIPLDLVVTDSESRKAQDVQGWKQPNPCFPNVGKQ